MRGEPATQTVDDPAAGGAETAAASDLRAWGYLVLLSWQRQARAHLMVWISLALLAFSLFIILLNNAQGVWDGELGFVLFSRRIVLGLYCGFLLPIWSLSYATEALGREREGQNLVWALTRPLSRPAIYLGKFVAALPWCLALNLGGFALMCLAAGPRGLLALELYWPAALLGTLAYAALFHLMGAWFRRSAVVAVLYSFFLESFMGSMPGYWKRCSISFYTRCLVFGAGEDYGVRPFDPALYVPVESSTAGAVLAVAALVLLVLGVVVFARSEYLDLN
jgi:hypothetical protein